jgi:hypothetical protein
MRRNRLISLVIGACVAIALVGPASALAAGTGPTAIGQDSNGISYVGFATGGTIARYDANGNALSSWGTPGTTLGTLGGIVAISVDPSNNVWVLDTNLHVQEFTTSGTYEGGFALPPCAAGLTPEPATYGGLAVTSSSVYVAHPCDDTILRYSLSGNLYAERTLAGRPRGIAVGPAGSTSNQVFVALPDQQEVDTFDGASFAQNSNEPPLNYANGTPLGSAAGTPTALTDKSTGDELIVADAANDYFYVYNPGSVISGQYSEYRTLGHGAGSSAGSVNDPVAMAQHPADGSAYDSNIYIADYGNQRIQRWNDSGYSFWTAAAISSGGTSGGSVPVNTAAPAIGGTPTVGSTLTCSTGSWNGSPGSYKYSWADNGSSVSAYTANNNAYTVQASDVGKSLTCSVIAINSTGDSQPATSAPVVPSSNSQAPANTTPPSITGIPVPTHTLTCNTGTWTGTGPLTYSYTWSANGTQVGTGQTFSVVAADVGKAITCSQTASGPGGSLTVASAPVSAVAALSNLPVGVSIDNGAIYTNTPSVELTIVPPTGTTAIQISNDGSFDEATTITSLSSTDRYPWTLQTSGNDRLPKTVYVRFTAPSVASFLTLTDTIILDQTSPTVQSATLTPGVTTLVARVGKHAKATWILTVRAKDKISGVAKLQYARTKKSKRTTVPYLKTIDISKPAQVRWVRAVSGAGTFGRWHRIKVK